TWMFCVPFLSRALDGYRLPDWVFYSVIMTLFLFVASIVGGALYQVLYFVAGFVTTRTEERPGSMSLSLGVLPWLVAPVAIVGTIVTICLR
ncbi:MAG: hypothetical protein JNM56_24535, partial [Planctomycetia bacterium]|nr:hypothetical protein [Planctomycetia bacterium]